MHSKYLLVILTLVLGLWGGRAAAGELPTGIVQGAAAAKHSDAVPGPVPIDSTTCLKCHGKPDIQGVTPRGMTLRLHIPEQEYVRSAHGGFRCVECHVGSQGAKSFDVVPHKLSAEESPTCLNCHQKGFDHVVEDVRASQHYKKVGGKVGCADCHEAHAQPRKMPEDRYEDAVEGDNRPCVACHTNLTRFKTIAGRAVFTQNLSHEFLPEKEKHFRSVRCVECHTPTSAKAVHRILPKEESLKDCTACHTERDSLYVAAVRTYADDAPGAGGFLGRNLFDEADLVKRLAQAGVVLQPDRPLRAREIPEAQALAALADAYAPGLVRQAGMDRRGGLVLAAVLALCLCHGAARMAGRKKGGELRSEYVYPLGVRLLHWLNAVLFLVLVATGLSIRFPEAALSLGMGGSVLVHDAAAVLLVANFAAFLLLELATGDIRQYAPRCRGLSERLARQLRYYLWDIFRGGPKPYPITREQRFNPLQQLTYVIVFWIGIPVLALTGAPLLVSGLAPETSRAWLAALHYAAALFYMAFLILHVYLSTTGDKPSSLLRGMITGRHEHVEERPAAQNTLES
ncbi:MAG: cytochrome b/b6 domain-containing protein [Desulfovibrionaceae bacterium]|jgi:thiosulfate reductase cytochrome b subunit|nr:cytochrome b/b6 domain-containing protein [Desulfovibrionaceae bacterium]